MPFANAIEGALCVDAIATRCIFLPETSLCRTRAPHFLQPSVLPDLPEAPVSGAECCAVSFCRFFGCCFFPSYNLCMYSFVFMELLILQGMMGCFFCCCFFVSRGGCKVHHLGKHTSNTYRALNQHVSFFNGSVSFTFVLISSRRTSSTSINKRY